jgi:hypothetical protein
VAVDQSYRRALSSNRLKASDRRIVEAKDQIVVVDLVSVAILQQRARGANQSACAKASRARR